MSKRISGLFSKTKGSAPYAIEETGVGTTNYNSAGSKDVKIVEEVNVIDKDSHPKLPIRGRPNSVTKLIHGGKADQERYYDENGDVYLDIDYSDHGNPTNHPIVPHEHVWVKDSNGKPQRKRYEKINR